MKMNKETNTLNNTIVILANIVVILSLASIFINIYKVPEFKKKMTGYALGYVNLTVNTQITLNVTNENVNFSAGTMTGGVTNATLTTHGANAATITNGNWSTTAQALAIANIGNLNCSITLAGTKTSASFFGGNAGDRMYQWNVSNKDANSCGNWSANITAKNVFADVNTSTTTFCDKLDFNVARNEMFIDFKLVVPYDANLTGAQSDIITISANTAI